MVSQPIGDSFALCNCARLLPSLRQIYKQMLVSFQVEQAKLGKTVEAAMREKQDEAAHWKKLYVQATRDGQAAEQEGVADGDGAAGALGVDERVKLQGEVRVCGTARLVLVDEAVGGWLRGLRFRTRGW